MQFDFELEAELLGFLRREPASHLWTHHGVEAVRAKVPRSLALSLSGCAENPQEFHPHRFRIDGFISRHIWEEV